MVGLLHPGFPRVGKILKKSGIRIIFFEDPEKVGNWLTKSGRVGIWVKKSGKCREFHVFEGVENMTQFKNKKELYDHRKIQIVKIKYVSAYPIF